MNGVTTPKWRLWFLKRLDATLMAFDLVLCAAFLSLAYVDGSLYFKGVGVGLLIAGVTSAVAVLYRSKKAPSPE